MTESPTRPPAKRSIPPLVWILAVGAVVRMVLLVAVHGEPLSPNPHDDEREYNELALSLARDGQFVLDGQPCSMRPPLYPAVVAGVYKFFGRESYDAVRALQAIAGLMTVCVLYLLASEVYNRRVGLWAAGLYALYPAMLGQANLLLSETLFTFWLVLFALMVVRCLRQPKSLCGNLPSPLAGEGSGVRGQHSRGALPLSPARNPSPQPSPKGRGSNGVRTALGYAVAAGVLLGLAALTRSVVWLFLPILAGCLLLGAGAGWGRRAAVAAIAVAAFAATIAPWSIRCTRLERTPVIIDVMGGRNFMMGNYEYTPLYRAWDAIQIEGAKSWYKVLAAAHPEFRTLTQGERDKLALRYGLWFAATHPGLTLQRSAIKLMNFWQLDRELVARMSRPGSTLPRAVVLLLALLIVGAYAAAMLTGVFGAFVVPPEDRRAHVFFLLLIGLVCAAHTLTFGHARYHLPLMPLVLTYSAAAMANLGTVWAARKRPWFWIAALVCAVLVASWIWQTVAMDLGRFTGAMQSLGG